MLRLASSVRLARRAFSTDVAPKIDWAELASFVHSDEAKREIQMLKKSLDDMKEQLAAEAKEPAPIDWAFYRKHITAPGVVDTFEKALKELKLPKYEGKEVEQLAAAFAELDKKAEAAAAKSAKRMEEIKKEIAAIAVEKEKLKTLTIDEILAADPALREKLNQEIREDKWY